MRQYRSLKDVTATSKITWVECTSGSCRAQYVIYCLIRWVYPCDYSPDRECYYCRSQGSRDNDEDHVKQNKSPAPTVQCNKCSNRIIWPEEYRTSLFKESDFICPLCTSGYGSTTELTVTPYKLFAENTFPWLVQGANYQRKWRHRKESIFQIISRMGTEGVLSGINFFPSSEPQLRYNGKPIRNSKKIISTLQKIVKRSKISDDKCSLCFSASHYSHLLAACGRDGMVHAQLCRACDQHYGAEMSILSPISHPSASGEVSAGYSTSQRYHQSSSRQRKVHLCMVLRMRYCQGGDRGELYPCKTS